MDKKKVLEIIEEREFEKKWETYRKNRLKFDYLSLGILIGAFIMWLVAVLIF